MTTPPSPPVTPDPIQPPPVTPPSTKTSTQQLSPPPNDDTKANRPNTQGSTPNKNDKKRKRFRERLQIWMQELPTYPFTPSEPDDKFQLIQQEHWDAVIKSVDDPKVIERMEGDKQYLDYHLLRLFRERDYEAKKQQNRYRLIQIGFMLLAAIATTIGASQALALSNDPASLPTLAFGETLIALLATFLATISGREPPLPLWLNNRRRAEQLRREYFRYILNLPPYDALEGYKREMEVNKRAADINRGVFPNEPGIN